MPVDGEEDVPTDVQPFFNGILAGIDVQNATSPQNPGFQLTSESGQVVAVTFQPNDNEMFELLPEAELAPFTRYTLTSHWNTPPTSTSPPPMDLSLSFTTGAGPLQQLATPPAVSMEHYSMSDPSPSTCSAGPRGSCISFPTGTVVEASFRDSFGQIHPDEIWDRPFFTDLTGINQGTNFDCILLKARLRNGLRSDPVTLCGPDAQTLHIQGHGSPTCTPQGIAFMPDPSPDTPTVATPSLGGCAVAGESVPARRAPAGWLLIVGLFVRRRRGGRRFP